MSKSMLAVGIILLSITSLVLINVLSNASTGSELDYYLVKDTTEAAMADALDIEYYRLNAMQRMDKEKFVESFLRRFADAVDNTRSYEVKFYDMNEVPPKVSVKVDSLTVLSFSSSAANISTSLDAVLETDYDVDTYTTAQLRDPKSDIGKAIEDRKIDN